MNNFEKIYERVRIPDLYWDVRLANIPDEFGYKKIILDWVENPVQKVASGKGLFLVGDYGTGKSACAALILRGALAKAVVGLWVNFRDIPDYIFRKLPYDEHETMVNRMQQVPILVIDEFDVGTKNYEACIESIDNLVRIRRQAKKPTIITSNHTVKTLENYPKDRGGNLLVSLLNVLQETVDVVTLSGKNFRKQS